MYDLDGDNKISKEELLAVLTMMVGANVSPEQVSGPPTITSSRGQSINCIPFSFFQLDSIAERTVLEADIDQVSVASGRGRPEMALPKSSPFFQDNCISFEEFCKVLERTDVEQKMSIRFLS
jgi:calcineurin B family protein 1